MKCKIEDYFIIILSIFQFVVTKRDAKNTHRSSMNRLLLLKICEDILVPELFAFCAFNKIFRILELERMEKSAIRKYKN